MTDAASNMIDDLATIGADVIRHDVIDERRQATVAETIPHQLARITPRTSALAGTTRFEEKHSPVNAGPQRRILSLRHAGHGDNALLESVEINLHRHWTTWSTRRCCLARGAFTPCRSSRA